MTTTAPRRRLVTLLVLLVALPVLLAAPAAQAAFAPVVVRGEGGAAVSREADLTVIRSALERRLVQQRLVDLGLEPGEAEARLDSLTDDEIHAAADQMRALVPGGDGVGLAIGVLLVVLIVVIILKLLDREIVIR